MTRRIKVPGGGHILVGWDYQRKLSPRRVAHLEYLRAHPELWDADLKVVVREMQSAGLISLATWWASCTGLLWVIEIARGEVENPPECSAVSECKYTHTDTKYIRI